MELITFMTLALKTVQIIYRTETSVSLVKDLHPTAKRGNR